jgi:uncharacterized protein YdbL (DUF1318 family)
MKKHFVMLTLFFAFFTFSASLRAQQDTPPELNVNTSAITEIREALKNRFTQLKPLLESGVLGVTQEGKLAVRDPAAIALAQRQSVTALIAADTRDKTALYREIARANGHPDWEARIAATFTGRMLNRVPAGWWVQDKSGQWVQK